MSEYQHLVGTDQAVIELAEVVRRTVFIEEQGVSEAEEMDGKDAAAIHVVLLDGEDPVGTARVRFTDEATAKVERVAVLKSHRGEGIGRRVVGIAESRARKHGADTAKLHSQVRVRGFYESLGYEPVGDQFEEAGIPHVAMVKDFLHSQTSR